MCVNNPICPPEYTILFAAVFESTEGFLITASLYP